MSAHPTPEDVQRCPAIESAAVALCWAERMPAFLPRLDRLTDEHKAAWWNAQTPMKRDSYRYRAACALEAAADAAE